MPQVSHYFKAPSLYKRVQDYEFLIPPFDATTIGALMGGKMGGIYGAAIGGILGGAFGITDKILIHSEITSRHYLTSGILGASIMSSFQIPYHIGEASGFAIGLFAPTGYLNNLKGGISIIMTTAITVQYAREKFPETHRNTIYGAMAGALIALSDEALIYFNVSNKHYLSTTTTIATTFDFMAPKFNNIIGWGTSFSRYTQTPHTLASKSFSHYPYASLSAGVLFGAYIANNTKIDVLTWKPISLGKDLLKTYKKVLNKEKLEKRIEIFALASITNKLLFHAIMLKENEAFQDVTLATVKFKDRLTPIEMATIWRALRGDLLKICVIILPPYILSQYIDYILKSYFSKQINYLVEDSINLEWLSNNTALKLSHSNSTTTLIHHKTNDISTMAGDGSGLMAEAFSKITGGTIAIGFVANNNAMDIFVYAFLYNWITSKISESIAKKINEYPDAIRALEASKDTLEKDIIKNIETIIGRGGIKYHLDRLSTINDNLRGLNEQREEWKTKHSMWLTIKNVFNGVIFSYATIVYKLSQGELDFNVRYALQEANYKIFSVISFKMDKSDNILKIEKATESVNTLIDNMKNDTHTTKYCRRKYIQGAPAIIFENFTVSLDDGSILIQLDSLKLTAGIYAITGPKGSGKSSFVSKIQMLNHNGIEAEGTITFSTPDGHPPIIISIPQIDHIPLNVSLLELFKYPQSLPKDDTQREVLSQKVQELWQRIDTADSPLMNDLNKIDDWETRLSGGQKKSVFIISAILQKPNILILDETLNELDAYSVQRAQDILKECVAPNSIILSIDHHAKNNNYDFYTACLNLTGHTFEMMSVD